MASLNRVQLIGSLSDNPKMRYMSSGENILSFMLDVEDEDNNFFPIQVWGKLADLGNKHLSKGSHIYLDGRLVITDKRMVIKREIFEEIEVDTYRAWVVVAKKIEFLDNQQLKRDQPNTKEVIEDVISVLRDIANDQLVGDPISYSHKRLYRFINNLRLLDVDNMD